MMTDTAIRTAELKQMLTERWRDMQDEVQRRLRDSRSDRSTGVSDQLERSDADIQGEIGFALLQMRAETLVRIDEALVRLDAGQYGFCFECNVAISARRLRALPFAVRCQECEQRREQDQGRAARRARQGAGFTLFPELSIPD